MRKPTWEDDDGEDWDPEEPASFYKTSNVNQGSLFQGYSLKKDDLDFLTEDMTSFLEDSGYMTLLKTEKPESNKLKTARASILQDYPLTSTCPRFRHKDIPSKFHKLAAGVVYDKVKSNVRNYGAKGVKREMVDASESPVSGRGTRGSKTPPSQASIPARSPSVSSVGASGMSSLSFEFETRAATASDELDDAIFAITAGENNRRVGQIMFTRVLTPLGEKAIADGSKLKASMASFTALKEKLNSQKYATHYREGVTAIFNASASLEIVDDEDLEAAITQQWKNKRHESIYLRLQDPEMSQRSTKVSFGDDGRAPSNTTRKSALRAKHGSVAGAPSVERVKSPPRPHTSPRPRTRSIRRSPPTSPQSVDLTLDEPVEATSKRRKSAPTASPGDENRRSSKRRKTSPKGREGSWRQRGNETDADAASEVTDDAARMKAAEPAKDLAAGPTAQFSLTELPPPVSPTGSDEERATTKGNKKKSRRHEDDEDVSGGDSDNEEEDEMSMQERLQELENQQASYLSMKTRDDVANIIGKNTERTKEIDWLGAACFWAVPVETFKAAKLLKLGKYFDLKCSFHPYQLAEAYQLYVMELSDNNGGIFANMMGMGKTRTTLIMLFIGHMHLRNYLEVQAAREADDHKRHNIAVEDTDGEGKRCPTANERPFTCCCDNRSIFFDKPPRLAPTIISGFGKATTAWRNEILEMQFAESKWCKLDDPHAMRFCWMEDDIAGLEQPSTEEMVEMMVKIDSAEALSRLNKSQQPTPYKLRGEILYQTLHYTLRSEPKYHEDATFDRPSPTAGRFHIICTHTTIESRVFSKMRQRTVTFECQKWQRGAQSTDTVHRSFSEATIWGRTIYDEFHNAKGIQTKFTRFYRDLRVHNRNYQWKSWALSGTPLERGLQECLIFISLALHGLLNWNGPPSKDKQGKEVSTFKNPVFSAIATLAKGKNARIGGLELANRWKKLTDHAKAGAEKVLASQEYKDLIAESTPIIETFMLRRTWETLDPWGNRLSAIKGVFNTYYRPCHDPELDAKIEDGRRRCSIVLEREAGCAIVDGNLHSTGDIFDRHEMIAISTYPNLASFKAALWESKGSERAMKLTKSGIDRFFKEPINQTWIAGHTSKIVENSKKFETILKICEGIKTTTRPNPKWSAYAEAKAAADGKAIPPKQLPAKVVIGSTKPIVQLMTALALKDEFGYDSVVLLRGGLNMDELDSKLKQW
ncbi:hypothetical protein N0V83_006448 [Neocucurbitaria cava]|uniref:SNF2 N-terminal domain-containing protein n=1 Tax=Neocucurbitaria cava TaxID=798079 RepID=A0A9W8Y605_9PLEO|nr:hypothetical protein N0V83_006448 [Neocucurbitaria cava]